MTICTRRSLLLGASAVIAARAADDEKWLPMFDGKSLDGWTETPYRNHGAVSVDNGLLVMGRGKPLTGVNYARPFPKLDFEVRWEAMRRAGNDFFSSLTFPVAASHGTFVTGGWGGDIVGLSSIDNWDASENETRSYFNFENNRWYTFRLKVTAERITGWIGEKTAFDVDIVGRTISMRPGDIERSIPFGFASYASEGALRRIEYRTLAKR